MGASIHCCEFEKGTADEDQSGGVNQSLLEVVDLCPDRQQGLMVSRLRGRRLPVHAGVRVLGESNHKFVSKVAGQSLPDC